MQPPAPDRRAVAVHALVQMAGHFLGSHGYSADVKLGHDDAGNLIVQLAIPPDDAEADAAAAARSRILLPR